jgi:hypothetical protein
MGYQHLPKILAVDVPRFGDDRTVLGLRQARHFRILAKLRGTDTVEVAHRVISAIESERPDATVVDGDGLGAGVVDILRTTTMGRRFSSSTAGPTLTIATCTSTSALRSGAGCATG